MGPRRGLAKKRVGAERTPEGKPICFRYNAPNGCKNGAKCHFAHVCSLCFQNHPASKCPNKKKEDAPAKEDKPSN